MVGAAPGPGRRREVRAEGPWGGCGQKCTVRHSAGVGARRLIKIPLRHMCVGDRWKWRPESRRQTSDPSAAGAGAETTRVPVPG